MAETEKITINMNVVDLGKVDLLVEQGFYSNRTDFIKTAIRNQLSTHSEVVDQMIVSKSYFIGVMLLNREELENLVALKKKIDIKVLGMLILSDDIDVALALKTIQSIKILGVVKASAELKKALKL